MDFHPNQVFMCVDEDGSCGSGDSLESAHRDYDDSFGNYEIENLQFYVAVPVDVEVRIVPKHVPMLVSQDPPVASSNSRKK